MKNFETQTESVLPLPKDILKSQRKDVHHGTEEWCDETADKLKLNSSS